MKEENDLKKLLREIPLETRIRVTNEMMLIKFVGELGLKEDSPWFDKDDELLNKIIDYSNILAKAIIEDIEEYNNDQQDI